MPIFQSSTFEYAGEGNYHDVRYMRCSNTPNHLALHQKAGGAGRRRGGARCGQWHGGDLHDAAVAPAATATICSPTAPLYGGTSTSCGRIGEDRLVECTFVDADDGSRGARATPTTRAFYVETLTNPLLEVLDLDGVVEFAAPTAWSR